MCVLFQEEDGIRDLVRSRGLGDVYKRQAKGIDDLWQEYATGETAFRDDPPTRVVDVAQVIICLLYTSDAADERSSGDLGGRRILKKKKKTN